MPSEPFAAARRHPPPVWQSGPILARTPTLREVAYAGAGRRPGHFQPRSGASLTLAKKNEPKTLIERDSRSIVGVNYDLISDRRIRESRKSPDLPRRRVEHLRVESARHSSRER